MNTYLTEHVYLFIQKMPEKQSQTIKGTIENGKFEGETDLKLQHSKNNKNVKATLIKGKIKGEYKSENPRKVSDEKTSIIDACPYKYVDDVNYNTSIAEAVFHHININATDDNIIKFDKIINIYDNKSMVSNEITYEKLKKYVKDDICDAKIEINIDKLAKNQNLRKDYDYDILLGKLLAAYDFKEGSKVYIATNGGQRDMMMFISTLAQILSHKGIESFMFYENIDGIVSQKKVSYYDLLRAVDLFIETGNPNKLSALYKNESELNNLIKKMEMFYEKIQVCRKVDSKELYSTNPDDSRPINTPIQVVYRELISVIDEISKDENSKKIPSTLSLILPNIKRAFVNVEWDEYREHNPGTWKYSMLKNPEELDILNIVKWCHDNNLITIGYFIFRVEMMNFITKCKGFLNVDFLDSRDLPNYQNIMNSNKNQDGDDENIDNSMLVSHMLRYGDDKNDASERLDALIILYSAYIYEKFKNDKSLLEYKRTEMYMAAINRKKEIKKESLEKFGFKFEENEVDDVYNTIMRCNLIRRIRNTLAHSDNKSVAGGVNSYLDDIILEYDRRLKERKKEGVLSEKIDIESLYTMGKTIESGGEDYYKVCHVLLGFLYEDMYERYRATRKD